MKPDAPVGPTPVGRTPDGRGSVFWVRVVPGASSGSVVGWQADGKLRVRVTAPPERGRANRAVVELLARALRVRGSAVRVVSGAGAREKRVEVDGVPPARVMGLGHREEPTR